MFCPACPASRPRTGEPLFRHCHLHRICRDSRQLHGRVRRCCWIWPVFSVNGCGQYRCATPASTSGVPLKLIHSLPQRVSGMRFSATANHRQLCSTSAGNYGFTLSPAPRFSVLSPFSPTRRSHDTCLRNQNTACSDERCVNKTASPGLSPAAR